MKLIAIHRIVRRAGKTRTEHSPKDNKGGRFECPDEEGQQYINMGAAVRDPESSSDKTPGKTGGKKTAASKKAAPKTDAVDPAKVTGKAGKAGDDDATNAGSGEGDGDGDDDDDVLG